MNNSVGVCIGGPKDGELIVTRGDIYKVAIPDVDDTLGLSPAQKAHDALTNFKVFAYRFYPGDQASTGLWIPIDKDLSWAAGQLVATYMEAKSGSHCKHS